MLERRRARRTVPHRLRPRPTRVVHRAAAERVLDGRAQPRRRIPGPLLRDGDPLVPREKLRLLGRTEIEFLTQETTV